MGRDGVAQAQHWDETAAQKNERITWNDGTQERIAVRIQSLLFTPPTKLPNGQPAAFKFKRFGDPLGTANPANNHFPEREYVDYTPPSVLDLPVVKGLIAEANPDSETAIRILTLVTEVESADAWPVWAEGNLELTGGSGESKQWHWGAKVGSGVISVIPDVNPISTFTNTRNVVEVTVTPASAASDVMLVIENPSVATFEDGTNTKHLSESPQLGPV